MKKKIYDLSGVQTGYTSLSGRRVFAMSGSQVGIIRNEKRVFDMSGNQTGHIRGHHLYDMKGNRIGDIKGQRNPVR